MSSINSNILSFRLRGEMAHYKKPDTNQKGVSGSQRFYTYDCVHRPSLLGMFGAILGLGGYNGKGIIPEYYQKLKHLKIAIKPNNTDPIKTICTMVNSTGFANTDGNYIWDEEILMNPDFQIFVKVEDEISKKLADYITSHKSEYSIYLGSSTYNAEISEVEFLKQGDKSEVITLIQAGLPENEIQLDKSFRFYQLPHDFGEHFHYTFSSYVFSENGIKNESCEKTEIGSVYWL